jgi:hypothetical protein
MKILMGCAVVLVALASISSAQAKGCIKGAAVGGVAGHYAGHHGVLGAAVGCLWGRHEAKKRERMERNQLREGESRDAARYN